MCGAVRKRNVECNIDWWTGRRLYMHRQWAKAFVSVFTYTLTLQDISSSHLRLLNIIAVDVIKARQKWWKA